MKSFKASNFLQKTKNMIFLGTALVGVSLVFGQFDLAKGILIGGCVGIFNFYIVFDTVAAAEDKSPRQAQNLFMRRAFARMFISFLMLLAAVPFGDTFLVGVTLGLVLQMLTHTFDALKLAVKGVK